MASPAVSFDGVSVRFALAGASITPFSNLGFEVPAGAFWTIIGPSGCGKSTLLRVVSDLVAPAAGTVRVFDGAPAEARRRRDVGFVFQEATLLPWRSVLDNVRLPLEVGGSRASSGSPEALLKLVGLERWHDALPQQLSGGMRQRVAIARAMVTRPRLLLMDEPFGALDELIRDELNDQLLRLWAETGMTVLFVTHSLTEAAYLGGRIMVMAKGAPARFVDGLDPAAQPPGPQRRARGELNGLVQELRGLLRASYGDELVAGA